jgi:hypothetical protein
MENIQENIKKNGKEISMEHQNPTLWVVVKWRGIN